MHYDYEKIIRDGSSDLDSINGLRIEAALANVVADEINAVHLLLGGIWYSIHGLFCSEVLLFKCRSEQFKEERINDHSRLCKLPILEQFVGLEVVRVRRIGQAWNGHGFEFSFKNIPDKTLILQSIYTGSEPKDFDDCMRIGVGNYIYQISGI